MNSHDNYEYIAIPNSDLVGLRQKCQSDEEKEPKRSTSSLLKDDDRMFSGLEDPMLSASSSTSSTLHNGTRPPFVGYTSHFQLRIGSYSSLFPPRATSQSQNQPVKLEELDEDHVELENIGVYQDQNQDVNALYSNANGSGEDWQKQKNVDRQVGKQANGSSSRRPIPYTGKPPVYLPVGQCRDAEKYPYAHQLTLQYGAAGSGSGQLSRQSRPASATKKVRGKPMKRVVAESSNVCNSVGSPSSSSGGSMEWDDHESSLSGYFGQGGGPSDFGQQDGGDHWISDVDVSNFTPISRELFNQVPLVTNAPQRSYDNGCQPSTSGSISYSAIPTTSGASSSSAASSSNIDNTVNMVVAEQNTNFIKPVGNKKGRKGSAIPRVRRNSAGGASRAAQPRAPQLRAAQIPLDGRFPKPTWSYSCLIGLALKNCPNGQLTVSEIYAFMLHNFPYFRTAAAGWKNSVRHNLSLNRCFMKAPLVGASVTRKSCLWQRNPERIEKLESDIRKWRERGIIEGLARPTEVELIESGRKGMPDVDIYSRSMRNSHANRNQQQNQNRPVPTVAAANQLLSSLGSRVTIRSVSEPSSSAASASNVQVQRPSTSSASYRSQSMSHDQPSTSAASYRAQSLSYDQPSTSAASYRDINQPSTSAASYQQAMDQPSTSAASYQQEQQNQQPMDQPSTSSVSYSVTQPPRPAQSPQQLPELLFPYDGFDDAFEILNSHPYPTDESSPSSSCRFEDDVYDMRLPEHPSTPVPREDQRLITHTDADGKIHFFPVYSPVKPVVKQSNSPSSSEKPKGRKVELSRDEMVDELIL